MTNTLPEARQELQLKLQKAVELELCTLPPYLTALWSIKPGKNIPAAVLVRSVMMEEMLHLTLAANVLTAVGGVAQLGERNIPRYPLVLDFKGERFKDRILDIDLAPLSGTVVQAFMQIELPAGFAPIAAKAPAPTFAVSGLTIGQFYHGIEHDLQELCGRFGETAVFSGDPSHQVSLEYYWRGGGRPVAVGDLPTALEALKVITEQGEGADHSLFDGDRHFFGQPEEVAHYFRFKEIYCGRKFAKTDKIHDEPSGDALPVNYGDVFPLKVNCKGSDYQAAPELRALNDRFNNTYSLMLSQLMEGLNGNQGVFYTAIMNGMRGLTAVAEEMVQLPIPGHPEGKHAAPSFEWVAPALGPAS
jgi:hypothetical protein